jgi:hypothetical protein
MVQMLTVTDYVCCVSEKVNKHLSCAHCAVVLQRRKKSKREHMNRKRKREREEDKVGAIV